MRKLWLTFTAMLLCSIVSFAQTRDEEGRIIINSAAEFLKIGTTGYPMNDSYIQTVDIDLGTFENSKAIIPHNQTSSNQQNYIFQGTYDGGGKTITYQASFAGTQGSGNYALFNQVSGTIKNLNVNANVTLSGSANNMNVALLCGNLNQGGVIEYCNVSGNVNSTVNPEQGGGSDAGLIVGESKGTVRYCTGSGSVVGVGYVGGLIGQMISGNAKVIACSFTGSVTANKPSSEDGETLGNFAGGICGQCSRQLFSNTYPTISFCTVDATINRENTNDGQAEGLGNSAAAGLFGSDLGADVDGGSASWTNCYGEGTVDGNVITTDGQLANNSGVNGSTLYFEGEDEALDIVEALNDAIPNDQKDKFYFDVVNEHVVLIIGKRPVICNAPTNLQVSISGSTANISWDAPEGATQFRVTKGGGPIISGSQPTLTTSTVEGNSCTISALQSGSSYTVQVETICGNDSYSEPVSISFTTSCPSVSNLAVNNITHETATATWGVSAETTFKVRLYVGNNTNSQHIREEETNSLTTINLSDLAPATQYTIEVLARCGGDDVEGNNATATFTTKPVNFETAQSGNFNDPNIWEGNVVPTGNVANITINTGHRVSVSHNLVITEDYKIVENNGVLQIKQQGQLINDITVPGIIEIVSAPKANQAWTFIGAPFDNYVLGCILPESHDVSVKKYSYTVGGWSDSWAHIGTPMNAGEGYFAFPFLDAPITFTTYGDVGTYEDRGNTGYTSTNTVTDLNISNVEVSLPSGCPNNWMALSNPYPAKLKVSKFLEENGSKLQGNCVYVFRDGTFDQGNISTGDIAMTEGFFVNFANNAGDKTITFNKGQLSYNNPNSAKASANEFIKLTLINGDKKVRAYLAHNEDAEQGYDIFDANKLFAPTEIAEPYFVTDGIELMKEEFAELPYYATMNVRSFADDTVSFVVENIPEGLSVSIIDGENIIDMVEGGVYSTEILTGENADRFKVLIKKSVSISDVEELEVNITNNNRHISIETTETDLQVEVYNALGQKVLSTKDRNFTLNQVSAGAYLIKAFNNKASKTQKIVVE